MFKKADLLFYVLLCSVWYFSVYGPSEQNGRFISVRIGDQEPIILDSTIDLERHFHGENFDFTLIIKEGKVHMEKSACKDKLCEKIGEIDNRDHQSIICLPQKIIISFIKDDTDEVLDGITG
ncbi:MAG: NusG domain II-containing protein [Candidatus Delongbacteria bacterium]|nr:NusG domain II-containing protein [Candidatus Delongbacteria bacterium]MBN2835242.1 NusG domain II-containing protein [Candidatus Delongbacteria bacterium]